MANELNEKQKRFADAYVISLNAKQSAIEAGYSENSAEVTGCRLLSDVKVDAYIQERLHKRSERTEITQDFVLRELAKIAGFDARDMFEADGSVKLVKDWNDSVGASVASFDIAEIFSGTGEQKQAVGLSKRAASRDKIKALELLGKHLGMFRDRVEVTGANGKDLFSPTQIVAMAEVIKRKASK